MWWPRQVGDAVLNGTNPFFAESLFWPEGQDVTRLLWNVLAELFVFPLWQLTTPLAALNLAAFLSAGCNAAACAWGARRLGAGGGAAWAAAALAGASHFAFLEMVNGRLEQSFWAPVAVFVAELAATDRRPVRAGIWLGLAAATYWFYGYFLLLVLVAWWLAQRSWAAARFVGATGAVSALTALPFLVPVLLATAPGRMSADTVASQAAASVGWPGGVWWPSGVETAFGAMSMPLYIVPFTAFALWRGTGPVRVLGAIALGCSVLALGPYLVVAGGTPVGGFRIWLPQAALNLLPGMERFWWSYRWQTVSIPAAILGLSWLLRRRPAALALLSVLACVETACILRGGTPKGRLSRQGVRPPPALEIVAAASHPSPVLVLPQGGVEAIFIGWQAWFRQPVQLGLGEHLAGVANRTPVSDLKEATAGFAYVLLFFRDSAPGSRRHDEETTRLEARLTEVYGRPFARNDIAAWWSVSSYPASSTNP